MDSSDLLPIKFIYHLTGAGSIILFIYGLLILYKQFIRPYFLIRFYKKQGIEMKHVPIGHFYDQDARMTGEKKDFFFSWKEKMQSGTKPKAFGGNMISDVAIVLTDNELVKEFYQKSKLYVKHPLKLSILKELTGNNISTLQDAEWDRHCKIMSVAFHNQFIDSIFPKIIETCHKGFDKIKEKEMHNVFIRRELTSIVGSVIAQVFFGEYYTQFKFPNGKTLVENTQTLAEKITQIEISSMELVLGRRLSNIGSSRTTEIAHYKASLIKNITEYLNKAKSENNDTNNSLIHAFAKMNDGFTPEEIANEFLGFYLESVFSVTALANITIYNLLKYPKYKKLILDEASAVQKNQLTIERLNSFNQLAAVIKENLRMYTPTPILFDRIALQDHTLGPFTIKKGTVVIPALITLNFDPDFYNSPNKFTPERWLSTQPSRLITHESEIFNPFSVGERKCFGHYLGNSLAKLLVLQFIQKFEYNLCDTQYEAVMIPKFVYEPLDEIRYKMISK